MTTNVYNTIAYNTLYPLEHIQAMSDAVSNTLGRHLGTFIADTEVEEILNSLRKAGYALQDMNDEQDGLETKADTTAAVNLNLNIEVNNTTDPDHITKTINTALKALSPPSGVGGV